MNEQLFRDLMLATFIQTPRTEEQTTVPLMIDVPIKWLHTMKTYTEATNSDFGALTEAVLTTIFALGLKTCYEDLQNKYPEPADLFKKAFGSFGTEP